VKQPTRVSQRDAGVVVLDAAIDAGPDKLAMLAGKHDILAPGTRELFARDVDGSAAGGTSRTQTGDTSRTTDVALGTFDADTCVRVAFDADAPTALSLQLSDSLVLATADGIDGTLGATGPICFRKTDAVTLHITGQSHVRFVVWASP
jgi:hypothetical protein